MKMGHEKHLVGDDVTVRRQAEGVSQGHAAPPPNVAVSLKMTGTPPPTSALTLRQQAEATIQKKAELSLEKLRVLSPEAMQLTLHELHVLSLIHI